MVNVTLLQFQTQEDAGDERAALDGLSRLLRQPLSAALRIRVYTTAISIAANVEDWPLAFTWLSQALSYLPEGVEQADADAG